MNDVALKTTDLYRPLRRTDVNKAAGSLLALKGVLAVQLFGSYARSEDDEHSDVDLIVISTRSKSEDWRELTKRLITNEDDDVYTSSFGRRRAFEAMFDTELPSGRQEIRWREIGLDDPRSEEFGFEPIMGYDTPRFDVFVFPPNWQEPMVRSALQRRGNHRDPEFMQNIAQDVVTYDPFKESFPWND